MKTFLHIIAMLLAIAFFVAIVVFHAGGTIYILPVLAIVAFLFSAISPN